MAENGKEEIDLLELAKKIWSKKIFLLKVSLIGLLVGIIIAFSIPKKYTVAVTLTSESGKSSLGNMGALASMAGINLGSGGSNETLAPELYPDLLNSTPFVQGLLDISVRDDNQDIDTTLYSYIHDKQQIAWWDYILDIPKMILNIFAPVEKSSPTERNKYVISENDMDIITAVRNSYSINTDKKSGVTSIEVTLQSPAIAAHLSDTLTSYLQTYIIEQRTQKAKIDLANTEKLYTNTKSDYYKAQQNLATFVDANMNVISAKYRINQEKLQNEANIAYAVYNQMAQQVQMNKIKIQDDTPVFTIIQPAIEPLYPASPKKKIIVLGFVFVALIGAMAWTLRKDLLGIN